MPWTEASVRPAASAAEAELQRDPYRSDQIIAAALSCAPSTVYSTRIRLEQQGKIQHIPPRQRLTRPRPPSQAALAILQGHATPQAIAQAAQVTIRTAYAQLARTRPRLAEAAGATDQLSVLDTTPSPAARATEALLANPKRSNRNVAAAAGCSEVTARRARERLERGGEILAYVTEDREPVGPPGPKPGTYREPPKIRQLPAPPDWSAGTCAHVPPAQQSWWTSSDPTLREAAANLCLTCPILEPCATWSLALPVNDPSVYAGMSQVERLRRKHEQRRLAAEQKPSPVINR